MRFYGKILSGAQKVSFTRGDRMKTVAMITREECPDGYYQIIHSGTRPSAKDGEAVWETWEVVDGKMRVSYECKPAPKTYSKLKIYSAISSLPDVEGVPAWARIQNWLEGKSLNGINGWMAFQLAQDISDAHPLFAEWASEAKVVLGLTDTGFSEILESCRA